MINIAVVDDEEIIREQIKKQIGERRPDCLTDTYCSGEELLHAGRSYDILFLDIQMDGRNGIETARAIREKTEDVVLIFVTGIKEYVFEAFDVAAFHYLLKPIEEEKFASVFQRAILETEKKKRQNQKQLFVKTRTRNVTLDQSRILYIESRAKKVEIHTEKEVIEAYAAIRELEKQLTGEFYRCHRGYLVNLAFITQYDNGNITLSNGETILLSKEKYSDFVKTYMRYLKGGGGVFV